jgi:hypothetical protein
MDQPLEVHNQTEAKHLVSGELLMYNMKQLDLLNTVMFLTAGCIAGILGLTGLNGLLLFLLTIITVYIGVFVRTGFKIQQYSVNSIFNLAFSAASAQCLTYILFWTLTYALVHIY